MNEEQDKTVNAQQGRCEVCAAGHRRRGAILHSNLKVLESKFGYLALTRLPSVFFIPHHTSHTLSCSSLLSRLFSYTFLLSLCVILNCFSLITNSSISPTLTPLFFLFSRSGFVNGKAPNCHAVDCVVLNKVNLICHTLRHGIDVIFMLLMESNPICSLKVTLQTFFDSTDWDATNKDHYKRTEWFLSR